MKYSIVSLLFLVLLLVSEGPVFAQGDADDPSILAGQNQGITTSVPFLVVAPDARASGMGDVGVATDPDANSNFWNPGKLAFIEDNIGFAISYTPWLANLVDDMYLFYGSGYQRISKEQTVAFEFRYFDLGQIQFTDNEGLPLQLHRPKEFTIGGSYSRILSDRLSVGLSGRYINSNLAGSLSTSTFDTKPGNSVAVDIGVYYKTDIVVNALPSQLSFGTSINNIGSKISYTTEEEKDFIPTNLKIGSALKTELDQYNTLMVALDVNKLMVPTLASDRDKPLLSGMFGSFGDAPGGFSEELKEFMISLGTEYWYNNFFAARLGYFYESADKGNRKFVTLGIGLKYQKFAVDFSYLVPQGGKNHPLADTLRFTLLFTFDDPSVLESVQDI